MDLLRKASLLIVGALLASCSVKQGENVSLKDNSEVSEQAAAFKLGIINTLYAKQGEKDAQAVVSLERGRYTGNIAVSLSGLPAGVSVTSTKITLRDPSNEAVFKLTVGNSVPVGGYTIAVTATGTGSGGGTVRSSFKLQVEKQMKVTNISQSSLPGLDGLLGMDIGPDGSLYTSGAIDNGATNLDCQVSKLKPDGSVVWSVAIAADVKTGDDDLCQSIKYGKDGFLYTTMYTYEHPLVTATFKGQKTLKLNPTDGSYKELPVQDLFFGDLYSRDLYAIDSSGYTYTGVNYTGSLVDVFNPDGSYLKTINVSFGGSYDRFVHQVTLTTDGKLVVVGTTNGALPGLSNPDKDWDVFYVKLDPIDGKVLDSEQFDLDPNISSFDWFRPYKVLFNPVQNTLYSVTTVLDKSTSPGKSLGLVHTMDLATGNKVITNVEDGPTYYHSAAIGPDGSFYAVGGGKLIKVSQDGRLEKLDFSSSFGGGDPDNVLVCVVGPDGTVNGVGSVDFSIPGFTLNGPWDGFLVQFK